MTFLEAARHETESDSSVMFITRKAIPTLIGHTYGRFRGKRGLLLDRGCGLAGGTPGLHGFRGNDAFSYSGLHPAEEYHDPHRDPEQDPIPDKDHRGMLHEIAEEPGYCRVAGNS